VLYFAFGINWCFEGSLGCKIVQQQAIFKLMQFEIALYQKPGKPMSTPKMNRKHFYMTKKNVGQKYIILRVKNVKISPQSPKTEFGLHNQYQGSIIEWHPAI
jgi:hypothetical protein